MLLFGSVCCTHCKKIVSRALNVASLCVKFDQDEPLVDVTAVHSAFNKNENLVRPSPARKPCLHGHNHHWSLIGCFRMWSETKERCAKLLDFFLLFACGIFVKKSFTQCLQRKRWYDGKLFWPKSYGTFAQWVICDVTAQVAIDTWGIAQPNDKMRNGSIVWIKLTAYALLHFEEQGKKNAKKRWSEHRNLTFQPLGFTRRKRDRIVENQRPLFLQFYPFFFILTRAKCWLLSVPLSFLYFPCYLNLTMTWRLSYCIDLTRWSFFDRLLIFFKQRSLRHCPFKLLAGRYYSESHSLPPSLAPSLSLCWCFE